MAPAVTVASAASHCTRNFSNINSDPSGAVTLIVNNRLFSFHLFSLNVASVMYNVF